MSCFPLFISLFSSLGITEWEAVVSSLHLSRDGPVCCANADRLEPLPLPHLSLQDLLCPQPPLPLLPVNMEKPIVYNSQQQQRALIFLRLPPPSPPSQLWDVRSLFPAELRLPASGSPLPARHHRRQGGGGRGPGPGLPDGAEGDVEAAHQPAVRRPAHAHARLLPLAGPYPQRGGVPEDGLQLEDEGGAGQLHAQCLLRGLRTRVVCQGEKQMRLRNIGILVFPTAYRTCSPPPEYSVRGQALVL